jgi:hypothetical protein
LKSTEDGKITWNAEKTKDKEISFLEAELDMIKKAFKDMDGKKEVPLHLMPLIERFE